MIKLLPEMVVLSSWFGANCHFEFDCFWVCRLAGVLCIISNVSQDVAGLLLVIQWFLRWENIRTSGQCI